jgi:aminobenzoyl-glutamate transport protein
MTTATARNPDSKPRGPVMAFLDFIEWLGNKLPDPAVLFVIGILIIWTMSAVCSSVNFTETLPGKTEPIQIVNMLTLEKLAEFLSTMTESFVGFHPLGVVLVAMLGVGVADHSGFISALLKTMLTFTPKFLLTPMVVLVAVVSHTAADAGYVVVIPLAGVIFYAAGRHPLAGIAAGFAGVSGGFSANFIPSGLDPLLAGLTTPAAQLVDPDYIVNPLCNWYFTSASTALIVLLGWVLTDFVIEPKLQSSIVDGDPEGMPKLPELTHRDNLGMICAVGSIVVCGGLLAWWALMPGSSLQATPPEGEDWELYRRLTSLRPPAAKLMASIVPLIFIFFLIPGLVHGFVSGTFKTHRDAIKGMSKAMESMGYYLVLVFFAALFIASFGQSGFGALLAVKGANFLKSIDAPPAVTIAGIILLSAMINLLVGSASAKWAMLSPIFVPMLMILGISPEFTQAAYRVGDSTTNIITPMMPYFPLVVVFCQRYVKNTGIGTVTSIMLPYSITFLLLWTTFLFVYWQLGFPLGIQGGYEYTVPVAVSPG